MLSIKTNTAAFNAQRSLLSASNQQAKSLQRLSSGLRINSAADDAAGLQISNRLTAQASGLGIAMRNANDGISMLQTAEGALNESTEILQRIRSLSIQAANGSNAPDQRASIQGEVDNLLSELTRINETTRFGEQQLFEQSNKSKLGGATEESQLINSLHTWLREAEQRIEDQLGIKGDNVDLTFKFAKAGDPDSSPGGTLAFVRFTTSSGGTGQGENLEMVLDMQDLLPVIAPNGSSVDNNGWLYTDRVIAHEMVHAVFARAVNVRDLPTWFNEGVAEFIHGGDERLAADIGAGTSSSLLGSVDTFASWPTTGTSAHYSEAYAAVRYMHANVAGGIKSITEYLANNVGDTLDDALASLNASGDSPWASEADFVTDFNTNGANFIDTQMDLTNADTGAIGGADADGGPVLDAVNVLPNALRSDDPTVFNEINLDLQTTGGGKTVTFQVGANANETISASFSAFSAGALGLKDLDLVNGAQNAITAVSQAIDYISEQRADMGAVQNRLSSTMNNLANIQENIIASNSRIKDTDYARESAELAKSQILTQAASAVLAQAQQLPQAALSLLG